MLTEKVSSSNSNDDSGLSNELSSMCTDSSSSISINSKKTNTCLHCLKEVEVCSRCSKCRAALYCDRVCQLKHWPVHKSSCVSSSKDDSDNKLDLLTWCIRFSVGEMLDQRLYF